MKIEPKLLKYLDFFSSDLNVQQRCNKYYHSFTCYLNQRFILNLTENNKKEEITEVAKKFGYICMFQTEQEDAILEKVLFIKNE